MASMASACPRPPVSLNDTGLAYALSAKLNWCLTSDDKTPEASRCPSKSTLTPSSACDADLCEADQEPTLQETPVEAAVASLCQEPTLQASSVRGRWADLQDSDMESESEGQEPTLQASQPAAEEKPPVILGRSHQAKEEKQKTKWADLASEDEEEEPQA